MSPKVVVRPAGRRPPVKPPKVGSPAEVFGEVPPAVTGETPPAPKKPGFVGRCCGIIVQDLHDAMNGGGKKRREDKELYRQFCELARGEKKV